MPFGQLICELFELRSLLHIHPSIHPFFLTVYLALRVAVTFGLIPAKIGTDNLVVCLRNKADRPTNTFTLIRTFAPTDNFRIALEYKREPEYPEQSLCGTHQ